MMHSSHTVAFMGQVREILGPLHNKHSEAVPLQRSQINALQNIVTETEEIGEMSDIEPDLLIEILKRLKNNVLTATEGNTASLEDMPILDESEQVEEIITAVDAALLITRILTADDMPRQIYFGNNFIDSVITLLNNQLEVTIYPLHDVTYQGATKKSEGKDNILVMRKNFKKRSKNKMCKSYEQLYSKLVELIRLVSDFVALERILPATIDSVSGMAVSSFFVEGVKELQEPSFNILKVIYKRYECYHSLLDTIVDATARVPISKRNQRLFKISAQDSIMMATGLVMKLIQSCMELPGDLNQLKIISCQVIIDTNFNLARQGTASFLSVLLCKITSKEDERDFRPIMENFVQDLVTAMNKPEWPVAELILEKLSSHLITQLAIKGAELSQRITFLDVLAFFIGRLRKEEMSLEAAIDQVAPIIAEVNAAAATEKVLLKVPVSKKSKKAKQDTSESSPNQPTTLMNLQREILKYLEQRGGYCDRAQHFRIAQWYRDTFVKANPTANVSVLKSVEAKSTGKGKAPVKSKSLLSDSRDCQSAKEQQQFLIGNIKPRGDKTSLVRSCLTYDKLVTVSRYVAMQRPSYKSCNWYILQLLGYTRDPVIHIRTKVVRCIRVLADVDPTMLIRTRIQEELQLLILDKSAAVREAVVDLLGKILPGHPELLHHYYIPLISRIMDNSVCVKKRIIRVLKEVCCECPQSPYIPDFCLKVITRMSDEDAIQKVVVETFESIWFTPLTDSKNKERRVENIVNVVMAFGMNLDNSWFEMLLTYIFKPKECKTDNKLLVETPPSVLTSSCQIIECLFEHLHAGLSIKSSVDICNANTAVAGPSTSTTTAAGTSGAGPSSVPSTFKSPPPMNDSHRYPITLKDGQCSVGVFITLRIFARVRPELLAAEVWTLQPYLRRTCKVLDDITIIRCTADILEQVLRFDEPVERSVLASLEQSCIDATNTPSCDIGIVSSCLSCLAVIVNRLTKNYGLIRDFFEKDYTFLCNFVSKHQLAGKSLDLSKYFPVVRRSVFVIAMLIRLFDFPQMGFLEMGDDLVNKATETMYYLLDPNNVPHEDVRVCAVKAIGQICIRHSHLMLTRHVTNLYHEQLQQRSDSDSDSNSNVRMKVEVLHNIENFLMFEEARISEASRQWPLTGCKQDLREMCDMSSGMSSTIFQIHVKDVIESYLTTMFPVRQAVASLLHIAIRQGLINVTVLLPTLIAMGTDPAPAIASVSNKALLSVTLQYPPYLAMKAMEGVRLSYQLQAMLQPDPGCTATVGMVDTGLGVIRGFRMRGEEGESLLAHLYNVLRVSKEKRRNFLLALLRMFDEQMKTRLSQLIYIADNLAYFTYQLADEPMFLIYHIEVLCCVYGTNVLDDFNEAFNPAEPDVVAMDLDADARDEDIRNHLLRRIPEDTTILRGCISSSQGCKLLLSLKQHLKQMYGITDLKMATYNPLDSTTTKSFDKNVTRRVIPPMNPSNSIAALRESLTDDNIEVEPMVYVEQYMDFKNILMEVDPSNWDEVHRRHVRHADVSNVFFATTVPIKKPGKKNVHQAAGDAGEKPAKKKNKTKH